MPDGLFVPAREGEGNDGCNDGCNDGADGPARLTFVALPPPTSAEIEAPTARLARRLTAAVERLCASADETAEILERTVTALRMALAATAEAPPVAPARLAESDGPLFEEGEGEWDATGTASRAPP